MIEDTLNETMPDGWYVTHLIKLSETDWQVNCTDDVHVVVATGNCIEFALNHAFSKIESGAYAGTLYSVREHMADETPVPLLARLGLTLPPKQPFNRRV